MIDLISSRNFYLFLAYLFIHIIVVVIFFANDLKIDRVSELIAEAILSLIISFFVFGSTIFDTLKSETRRIDAEQQETLVSVALYLGIEIMDNVAEIDKMLELNAKTESEMPVPPNKILEKYALSAMWAASANELNLSLNDKWHQSLVESGLVSKLPDKILARRIRETYQRQDHLKNRLRGIIKFYEMIKAQSPNFSVEFIQNILNEKLKEGTNMVLIDIKIFKEKADITLALINELIEPYGEKLEAHKYEVKEL